MLFKYTVQVRIYKVDYSKYANFENIAENDQLLMEEVMLTREIFSLFFQEIYWMINAFPDREIDLAQIAHPSWQWLIVVYNGNTSQLGKIIPRKTS